MYVREDTHKKVIGHWGREDETLVIRPLKKIYFIEKFKTIFISFYCLFVYFLEIVVSTCKSGVAMAVNRKRVGISDIFVEVVNEKFEPIEVSKKTYIYFEGFDQFVHLLSISISSNFSFDKSAITLKV